LAPRCGSPSASWTGLRRNSWLPRRSGTAQRDRRCDQHAAAPGALDPQRAVEGGEPVLQADQAAAAQRGPADAVVAHRQLQCTVLQRGRDLKTAACGGQDPLRELAQLVVGPAGVIERFSTTCSAAATLLRPARGARA
jgi:hypothetical protein